MAEINLIVVVRIRNNIATVVDNVEIFIVIKLDSSCIQLADLHGDIQKKIKST